MQRLLQVQYGAWVPGAEARRARPPRAGHAHRHLRGRPPPRRQPGGPGYRIRRHHAGGVAARALLWNYPFTPPSIHRHFFGVSFNCSLQFS
jgi:hypothetical protein